MTGIQEARAEQPEGQIGKSHHETRTSIKRPSKNKNGSMLSYLARAVVKF